MPDSNLTPPAFDGNGISWLLHLIAALLFEVQALRAKLAAFEKDSTTSHKPPSSDGLRKKHGAIKRGSSGRKPGGQKGHRGLTRRNLPPSEVTAAMAHQPKACEQCHAPLTEQHPRVPVERRQVWEIPEIKPLVIEHVFYQTTCDCGHPTRLSVPTWIYSGTGENLQAHITSFTAEIPREKLLKAVEPLIADMRAFVENNQRHPTREVARFNRQLRKRWHSLFTFIYHEGVEPTNNLAERLIRPGVQTRKISYGTRSETGQLLRARLLTISQTCRLQQRNALDFYRAAIHAHRHNLTMPSLLLDHREHNLRLAA